MSARWDEATQRQIAAMMKREATLLRAAMKLMREAEEASFFEDDDKAFQYREHAHTLLYQAEEFAQQARQLMFHGGDAQPGS